VWERYYFCVHVHSPVKQDSEEYGNGSIR
jgi:hypothetical protein